MEKSNTPNTAIIVLNWNNASDTIRSVHSLLEQTVLPKIVIVDNASSDDSLQQIHQEFDDTDHVHIIANSENSGFAGGINRGFHWALKHDYAFIGTLNPDATAKTDWLEQLLRAADQQPKVGIFTGLFLNKAGDTIDSTGELMTTWGIAGPRGRGKPASDGAAMPTSIFGASGGNVLYRRELLRRAGLFDERFFMYFEDIDLSYRAQLLGNQAYYQASAISYHDTGSSSRKIPGLTTRYFFRNTPMVFYKNTPLQLLPRLLPLFWLSYLLLFSKAIASGRGGPALIGALQSLLLLPHTIRARWQIQQWRQIEAEELYSRLHPGPLDSQTGLHRVHRLLTTFTKKS